MKDGIVHSLIGTYVPWFFVDSYWWTVLGLVGNAVFSSRFIIQWLYSEKVKKVVVPEIFWHLSFWGSVIMLIYSLHVDKVPIILGYIALPFVYGRNLSLLKRETQN